MIFDERVDGLPKNGGAADPRDVPRETKRARDFRSADFDAHGAGRLDVGKFPERVRSSVSDELAVINVGYVAAALGFIHVVRSDEKRDAVSREFEEQVPKLPSRHRIDPGGRFVEKK